MSIRKAVFSWIVMLSSTALFSQNAQITVLLDSAYTLESIAPEKAIELYERIIKTTDEEGDYLNQGKALSYIGLVYMAQGQYDSLFSYNQKARILFEKIEYDKGLASIDNNEGNAYLYQGNYYQALESYQKALPFYEQEKMDAQLTIILNNMASLFQHNEDFEQSLPYLNQALEIAKKNNDAHALGNSYNNICVGYLSINEYEAAYNYGDSAVFYINQTDDASMQIKIESNLARMAINTNRLVQAKNLIKSAKDKAEAIQDLEIDIVLNQTLATYHGAIGEHKRSIQFGKESLEGLKVVKDLSFEIDVLQLLKEEHSILGDYKNALFYANRLDSVKANSFLSKKNEQTNMLASLYNSNKKDKALNEQRSLLDKQRIERSRLFAAFGILSALVLSIFYYYSIQRRKTREALILKEKKINEFKQAEKLNALDYMMQGQENERKRIAQDLHDGLGGLLTSVKRKVDNIADQITALQEQDIVGDASIMIEKACEEVRRISHDMMPASLVSLSFQEAIDELILDFSGKTDISITYQFSDYWKPLSDKTKTNLYRIIQEALSNSVKHSNAKNIGITLLQENESLYVEFKDDGKGFDQDMLAAGNGIGLKNIQSRVTYLGGALTLETNEGCNLFFMLRDF